MLTAVQPDVFRLELQTPLPVGSVNAFVVKSADAVVLVDCGLNHQPTRDALVAGLAQLGVRPEDVTAVVLTHGHVDHVGAASLFQEKDVPIYALPGVQTWLQPGGPWEQYRLEFFDALYRTMGLPDAIRERAKQEFFTSKMERPVGSERRIAPGRDPALVPRLRGTACSRPRPGCAGVVESGDR
ncbi:hypothetical protein GCM10025857_37930 [Alicyclobacillus contaminans]|nr:hypothetical protein GCM10025857_37930 [Alicyclobacillus contaminans]